MATATFGRADEPNERNQVTTRRNSATRSSRARARARGLDAREAAITHSKSVIEAAMVYLYRGNELLDALPAPKRRRSRNSFPRPERVFTRATSASPASLADTFAYRGGVDELTAARRCFTRLRVSIWNER